MIVDVISDVVCPWCFVGKRQLEKAMQMRPGAITEVRWRPYQLDPTTPIEGRDRRAHYKAKFGDNPQIKEMRKALLAYGDELGIAFDFESDALVANTLNAHRLIRWAGGVSTDCQNAIVNLLMTAYFEECDHLGDPELLVNIAKKAGMDGEIVQDLLNSDRDKAETEAEIAQARQMGVTGVPCFIFDGKAAVQGAQSADVLAQIIDKLNSE